MEKSIVEAQEVLPIRGYFKIFKNGVHSYNLMKDMNPLMNQDKLAEFYETEKSKGNPIPMNSIQHYELFDDAVKSGNTDLLNFLREGLDKLPNTLTRTIYNPKGEQDEIIHNYGTSDSYSIVGDVGGNGGWIDCISNMVAFESIVGMTDIKRLNEILSALNGTLSYLPAYESKPSKKIEGIVGFSYSYGRPNPSAYISDWCERPAFLVKKVK